VSASSHLPVIDQIVVGHDGSDGAKLALEWAAALADRLPARVVVVRAYSPLEELGHVKPPIDFAALEAQRKEELEHQWCVELGDAGISFEARLVEQNDPVQAIVDVVHEIEADLVVIGSHGASGWRERIAGRVATKLPYAISCPVTLVPLPKPA
jgi:nucleotide-binding universal stress UspA family protein